MYSPHKFPGFSTKNNLDFWSKNYEGVQPTGDKEDRIWFIVGTCRGMYIIDDSAYDLWAIGNSRPGNGHFDDVLQWFEFFCNRDNKDFIISRIENTKFRSHLIGKRGFAEHGPAGVIKKIKTE